MISLFNMLPDEKKRPNSLGLMDMFEGVKDAILPILSNTPYGSATRKIKEHGMDFTRELGHGLYTDLPQGVIDLGTDIINSGGNLLGVEGDFIDRESVQVVPPVFDEGERKQLGMKSLEEDSIGRILGQLLGGYAGIRGVLSKGLMSEAVAVSGAGSTLDPERPNLSNFIQDTRFNNLLFEYMSAGVPEEAGAEERLLARVGNMTEELGLAFIPLGLIQGIRAMKSNPAIKEQLLDTFHPDRMGGLLSDKTGLTTDYRMFAVPEKPKINALTGEVEGELIQTPHVDSAGFYSKLEQQVLAMKQDKMQASHVEGFLKGRGVSPSEMKDMGLLDMLDGLPEGEMITKQGLLDHIDKNRITMTSDSLVPGGGLEEKLKSLDAPDPNDYYISELDRRNVHGILSDVADAGQLRRVDMNWKDSAGSLWETERWYNAEGTENQWKIMENEHQGMRNDEIWDEISGELEVTFDEHGAFQKEKTGDMFTSLQTFEELHKLYPDKYPETTVMRMDRLRRAIRSREASSSQSESLKSEIVMAQKELDELEANFKWGTEWDADILRGLKDGYLDNKIMSDMDEAVDARTTLEYMNSPYFEIEVGDEALGKYRLTGNDDVGWEIWAEGHTVGADRYLDNGYGLMGDMVNAGHMNLAEAQVRLRQYIMDENFVEPWRYAGEAKYARDNWVQPNADMDTYSEELVRLEGRPEDPNNKYYTMSHSETYEAGHYGDDYPDTIGHFRKTIRSGMVVNPDITIPNRYNKRSGKEKTYEDIKEEVSEGYTIEDDNVYFVEEVQSDWMQSGREFGFGEEANEQGVKDAEFRIKELQAFIKKWQEYKVELNRVQTKDWVTDATGKRLRLEGEEGLELFQLPTEGPQSKKGYQERLINLVDNKILQKAFQQGEVQGQRMKFSQNTESIDVGFDPNEYSRTIQPHEVRSQKEWNERWKVDPRNPQAENFKGFGDADIEALDGWMWQEIQRLNKHIDEAPSNIVPEFTPVKDQDRDVHLLVKRAIAKAIENGSTKVAFPNGDMILNLWNRHRDTTYHKKVRFEELYKNLYDKKIPKFLKKYAGQHKGKVGKMYIEDFQREVIYLEITPEMRESFLREVEPPYQTTKNLEERGIYNREGLIHPQSLYAKYPLPIGAGLLGMQEEKNQSGLLN